jgi:hypothetical protein
MPTKILDGINSPGGGPAGVGILGMKERIHQIGGYLEVASDRRGTTVTAVVPAGNVPAGNVPAGNVPAKDAPSENVVAKNNVAASNMS